MFHANFLKPIIGLTGGIGSGKTAVSDYFAKLDIDIVDADVIAHRLSNKGSPMLIAIKDRFGDWVLDADGNYNRSAMRAFIFDSPDRLVELNAITHPIIVQTCLEALTKTTSPYAILSAPLLLENKDNHPSLYDACTRILVVDVPPAVQLERASQRDRADPAQIQKIMTNQLDRTTRLQWADDVVDNSGTLVDLYTQLSQLHTQYLHLDSGVSGAC